MDRYRQIHRNCPQTILRRGRLQEQFIWIKRYMYTRSIKIVPRGGPLSKWVSAYINLKMGGPPLGTISMDLAASNWFHLDYYSCIGDPFITLWLYNGCRMTQVEKSHHRKKNTKKPKKSYQKNLHFGSNLQTKFKNYPQDQDSDLAHFFGDWRQSEKIF